MNTIPNNPSTPSAPSQAEATPRFTGTFTALVTPFREHSEYLRRSQPVPERYFPQGFTSQNSYVDDFDSEFEEEGTHVLLDLVSNQVRANVGIVLLGTTGESSTVTAEERTRMIQRVVSVVNREVPMIIGTGTNDTQETMDQTYEAAQEGADAALLVTPYYNRPTQTGLRNHYGAIADASPIPIILYDVPKRTGVAMDTKTILELSQHPNIAGVKWASGDMQQIDELAANARSTFSILSGDDNRTVEAIGHGAHGVISVLSNLLPEDMRQMVDAAREGRMDEAQAIHRRLETLMEGCFLQTNPLPIKTALAFRGDIREVFRLPLCPMDREFHDQWTEILRNAGISPRPIPKP